MFSARQNHLRHRGGGHARVTNVELFFDLVFVFAVTQLSHGLLEHLTPLGAVQIAVLTMAVWWQWIDTAWITNWLDPDRPVVRLFMFAQMLAALVIAAAIPRAFDDRGAAFALAYLTMQVGRDLFMLWALRRHDHNNWRNFLRITVWHLYSWPFWIAGVFTDANTRLGLWAIAVALESLGPPFGFYVPGLGRSSTTDWNVEGAHMAERCSLFVIIALGESILITGATAAGLPWSAENGAAFVTAFAGSVAMWAVYFNIGAERASRLIAASDDPGRLARSGYTYLHIPIVAGIILAAVGDELVLQHPSGHASLGAVATIVGGPALYLLGNALFKRLSAPTYPLSHLVGLGLLALLAPAGLYLSPLALAAGATAILIIVVIWEWMSFRPRTAT
jgi:low temperature requirement protein LtrA